MSLPLHGPPCRVSPGAIEPARRSSFVSGSVSIEGVSSSSARSGQNVSRSLRRLARCVSDSGPKDPFRAIAARIWYSASGEATCPGFRRVATADACTCRLEARTGSRPVPRLLLPEMRSSRPARVAAPCEVRRGRGPVPGRAARVATTALRCLPGDRASDGHRDQERVEQAHRSCARAGPACADLH